MSKPKAVIPDLCKNHPLFDNEVTFSSRDVILYALGIGVSMDPMDPQDLTFTYEMKDAFATIPSYASCITPIGPLIEGLNECPGLPDFNPMMLLHGEEKIELVKPVPTSTEDSTVRCRGFIRSVVDKGSGALVNIGVEIVQDGEVVCVIDRAFFIRGLGGFGGPKDSATSHPTPKTPPHKTHIVKTSPNQALLYRLSGDFNPLHIDPAMSALGGFPRPILHGLCTFGIAVHGVVKQMAENDATQLASVQGRFSKPVIPGDVVRVEMWRREPNEVLFRVVNATKGGEVCVSNGRAMMKAKARL
eukprot:GHVN01099513.1.p1 GENE.GHVN01099513.1~~GHVN01099513.1.p1  ORF type:complete len:302 (+),score=47.69 GHVN01099513.1:183-1088(+)